MRRAGVTGLTDDDALTTAAARATVFARTIAFGVLASLRRGTFGHFVLCRAFQTVTVYLWYLDRRYYPL